MGEAQKLLNAIKSEKTAGLTPANVEKSTENEQKIPETGDVRHAFNQKTLEQMDNYRKRIDAWDGKTEGFAFVMGDAPAYLSELEVSGKKIGKKQVRIDATKIKSIMDNHSEMTRDVIKNLPYLLNEPILVLDSKTVQGRLVLLGEVYANGKPVMMALEINPSTRSGNTTYVDVIKIASAYVRTNTQNLINNSNIRYIDKNKSRVNDWLKVNRLQLPLPNSQSNSATNSIIPENSQKINTLGKKSAETQEKSAKTEQKPPKKGKKVEISISDELKAAGEFAEANVPEYKELSVPNKRAVRKTIIQAKAEGISDADIITFARFSAKSGINLSFDKSKLITGADENGNVKYSDGMYDGNNTIYVNKDSSRKYSSLLFHELTHFLFKNAPDKLTRSLLKQAVVNMPNERRNAIVEAYSVFYGTKVGTAKLIDIIHDEWFAHYTEDVLTDIDVLSFLDSKKPTLKETILRFFSKSANEYKGVEQLSSAARKYATKYRKLFNQIAELNQQNISTATDIKPLARTNQEKMHVIGDNNRKISNATSADVDTDVRYAIKFLSEEDLPGYLRAGGRANQYKRQAIDNGKKIILTAQDEIREYIEKAIAGEKDLPTVAYGKVDIKLSKETSDYSNGIIQISNYYLELVATDIRHAYQEHLHAKEKGDIDLSVEDFMNIPIYVATYDDFVYATKYKSGNAKICLSKKISDGRVLVIETVSKSHGSIEFKNMIGVSEEKYLEEYEKRYKKRNGTNTGGSMSSNNSPRDETASNTIISKTEQKSNTFDKKSSEISDNSRRALPETADAELSEVGIGVSKEKFEEKYAKK